MYQQITVSEYQRAIVTRNHRVNRVLKPGSYRLISFPRMRVEVEWHSLRSPMLRSRWSRFLVKERQDIVLQHFVTVRTGPLEIAMISVNGQWSDLLLPEKVALCWKDAGHISIELVDIGDVDRGAPPRMFSKLDVDHASSVNSDESTEEDLLYQIQEES